MPDSSLIEGVRAFIAHEIAPMAVQVDENHAFPPGRWEAFGESGLTGLTIPPDFGGLGLDRETALAAIEMLGGACASSAWALLCHLTVATGILRLGSTEQKKHYLPALAEARMIGGTLGGTETGGGTNPMAIKTFARADGDDYVLDGGKFFNSQAGTGDVYLILARTDKAMGPDALTCFIVEKDDPGVSFGPRESTAGLHGVDVHEILFRECRIPATRILGRRGAGLAVLGATGDITVLGSAAAALGIAQAAFDATIEHLKERHILGKPLGTVSGVQSLVARLILDLDGARARLAYALGCLERGIQGPPLSMWLSKIAITDMAPDIVARCLRLHGATGYSTGLPLERMLRDVHAFGIHWGNNDALLDMIGMTVMGE